MKLKSLKNQLNNQKGRFYSGKIAKSSFTFHKNKPNFKNIKIAVSYCKTSKYEILPACRAKKQTQFKADSNPITEMPKLNATNAITMNYENFPDYLCKKTKPIQTQTNPISNAEKRTKEVKKKKRASGTFLRLWIAGKIDFSDGCDILLGKIYGKTQFNLFGRLIL